LDVEGILELSEDQIRIGTAEIRLIIPEFNYETALNECTPVNLLARYNCEKSSHIKMLILRAYIERERCARGRLRDQNDILRKFVDETFHIENDYLYSLDVRQFNMVPDHYVTAADDFVSREIALSTTQNSR